MMRNRPWGAGHRGRCPDWWPEGEPWPAQTDDWSPPWGDVRRVVRRTLAFLFLLVVVPLVVGTVLAVSIGGLASIGIAGIVGLTLIILVPLVARAMFASFTTMEERLEHTEVQRRELLAEVGHELRTPLTVIRGELEAFLDGVHEPDANRISELLADVAVMERLLGDLQTLSTSEAGMLTLHTEPTDLVELVASVLHNFATATPPVRLEHPDEHVDVDIDPVRIREVVSNLVTNALRATAEDGSVVVRVASEADAAVIQVVDSGSGIPPDQLDAVFDRFHKGLGSDGTGLGLTVSRHLVEAHGGTIAVDSVVGEGTTVRIDL